MSIFPGASHVAILGGAQVSTGAGSTLTIHQSGQAGVNRAFKELSTSGAPAALHNSAARFDAPRCHRNTRTKYLDKFEMWMLGIGGEYDGKRLIWIHGGAGAGKSAIMQSTVERCARHGVILGSFFFSRTDPARNYAEVLIPTLAFQVARMFPLAMDILEPTINHNPVIFQESLQTQTYELLIRPLRYLIDTGIMPHTSRRRLVFVIDGLDECNDPQKQSLVIQVIASVIRDYQVPIGFLIASRPEMAISSAFRKEDGLGRMFESISLERDADAESDIRRFIEDSFVHIVNHHPLRHRIILPWPDSLSVAKLVWKSSGHFIYAATAMKFISSPSEYPVRALRVVEGLEPPRMESPFAELDSLYLHILMSAKYRSEVLGILRHCYLTAFSHSVTAIGCIYDISPGDIELFLFDVQSLVFLTRNITGETFVVGRHASLKDFFLDAQRTKHLYMTGEDYHASVIKRYFQLLDNGSRNSELVTSLHFWPGHEYRLIQSLATAVKYSRDIDLVRMLISTHSPEDIWNFCTKFFGGNSGMLTAMQRDLTTRSVCDYMRAIRDSVVNVDNTLYIQQFGTYVQLILDDLAKILPRKPQYRIIPALMFSSRPAGLVLAYDLLRYCRRYFRIGASYQDHFESLQGNTVGVIDSRSYQAIRCLRQSRLAWSADLAVAMGLVLQRLIGFPGVPGPRCSMHAQWLRRNKAWKRTRLGFLKPSSRKTSRMCIWLVNRPKGSVRRLRTREQKCVTLLGTIVHYLHKADCTSDVVKLARKSLPTAALEYPKLMRRARARMDAYVCRWEDSVDGLLETARSFSVNNLD